MKHAKPSEKDPILMNTESSLLGGSWVPIYLSPVDFDGSHFLHAMANLIKEPNINSTVIMRADFLSETTYENDGETIKSSYVHDKADEIPEFSSTDDSDEVLLHRYLLDVSLREVPLADCDFPLKRKTEVVRRMIPRNPFKDHIINQTCLVMTSEGDQEKNPSVLVVYVPHLENSEEIPFYLPPVYGVGILLHEGSLSIHYLPFNYTNPESITQLRNLENTSRPVRIALRLLQTSSKHSLGAKDGYEKRVNHDVVVPKIAFQNRYISLKKKYSSKLVNLWVESTDPKKHVFEDLAIAAFLIELWSMKYLSKDEFEYRDLGCGNGLLVYILQMEGYKGQGIDARARKSWKTYPQDVQDNLLEQVVIPSILLKPHPAVSKLAPHVRDNGRLFQVPEVSPPTAVNAVPLVSYYSLANLLESTQVCTTEEFPPNTFIIGNHSDELTCWIPLLGFPFAVIPCCSHALLGAKKRYPAAKLLPELKRAKTTSSKGQAQNSSTYGSLVDHVEELSKRMGWKVEREMLRIPSTRNAALIGMSKLPQFSEEPIETTQTRVMDILALEGGAEGWVENTMALMKKNPRNH